MFRKTKIFSLALLFIISTTGLPITVNLCKMAASERNQCVMHNKLVSSGCCAHETSEQKPSISFNKYNCCEIDFIYKKVEDQYLVHKTSLDYFSSQQIISHSTDFIPSIEEYFQNESFYTDSSPPFLINSDLHITNSILLI
ncbi:MAG: hypothetical protein P8X47_02205 [Ignavibacteriaceae bacterium]